MYYDKGFNKPLIDDEGFPRADLDFGELVTYKNLRREFNEKNNDYKDLMK
jgi:26S proteasome non-ATPase regulatory subunit 9